MKDPSVLALVAEGSRLRPTRSPDPVTAATTASLSSLAHRIEALLVATVPELLGVCGSDPTPRAHW
jgi:hypothetical protein